MRPSPLAGLLLLLLAGALPGRAAEASADVYRPRDFSELDAWDEVLFETGGPGSGLKDQTPSCSPGEVRRALLSVTRAPARDLVPELWQEIRRQGRRCGLHRESSFRNLLEGLLSARLEIPRSELARGDQRRAMGVLSLATQEALAAHGAGLSAAGRAKEETKPVWIPNTTDAPASSGCSASYLGVPVCPGDVILSRGGGLAAVLIALRGRVPELYTHVQLVGGAVTAGGRGRPVIADSDIHGTSLSVESLRDEEESASLIEAIYRPALPAAGQGSFRQDIERATRKLGRLERWPSGEFALRAADFSAKMHIKCDGRGYFCAELLYCLADGETALREHNPYPRAAWSTDTDEAREFFRLLIDEVKPNQELPLPGDVEYNEHYRPVGWRLELEGARENRLILALSQAYVRLTDTDSRLRDRFVSAVRLAEGVSFDRLSAAKLVRWLQWWGAPPAVAEAIQQTKALFPKGHSVKDVLFVGHVSFGIERAAKQRLEDWVGQQPGWVSFSALAAQAEREVRREMETIIENRWKLRFLRWLSPWLSE